MSIFLQDTTRSRAYPLIIFFHMANADEHYFVHSNMLKVLDALIVAGAVPPVVVAAPDGLLGTAGRFHRKHSLFINGPNGRFEDHILYEVLPFLMIEFFDSRRARSARTHGGFRRRVRRDEHGDRASGILRRGRHDGGALNLRYFNADQVYFEDFDPATYRWKAGYDPNEVIGSYLSRAPAASRQEVHGSRIR